MPKIGIRELLEAGAHFGHQAGRWNPKMKRYIYNGPRNGIHIIDLTQTVGLFDKAYQFVVDTVANGKPVLFVGTKKQAQEIFKEEATRAGQFFVTNRWLGGSLTNWRTIRKSIARLRGIEKMQSDGTADSMAKKEALRLEKVREKLEKNLGGIKDMETMPGAVFLVDTRREHIAVQEASIMGIPVVGVVDTNSDPTPIAWPIPGNDDAIRSIRLFASRIADACIEGKAIAGERRAEAPSMTAHVGEEETVTVTPAPDMEGPEVQRIARRPRRERGGAGTAGSM
ncbi:MAG: 30S ribosomal protein S2 [Bradymonadales bacterium]|nr:30S ribosomal protein S2 [Bradymonadales bacterium]